MRRTSAVNEMMAIEYIAIRWYQHNLQGLKLATSLKYRLPIIEPNVTRKMRSDPASATVSTTTVDHLALSPVMRATAETNPAARTTTARIPLKSCTASVFTPPFLRLTGGGRRRMGAKIGRRGGSIGQ